MNKAIITASFLFSILALVIVIFNCMSDLHSNKKLYFMKQELKSVENQQCRQYWAIVQLGESQKPPIAFFPGDECYMIQKEKYGD